MHQSERVCTPSLRHPLTAPLWLRCLRLAAGVWAWGWVWLVWALGGVATTVQAQDGAAVRIRFAHVVAEDTPKGQTALRFKALLESRSAGQIQVEVYPGAQLYGDRDEIEAVQLGAVEMLAPSLSKFGPMGFAEFELFDLPFLFASESDVHRITQGPLGQVLLQRLQRQQLVGLGFLDNGFKHMSANRPLLEVADYAGLRMRVQSSRTIARQMSALGVQAVDLPFSDTRRALSQGVVDGSENPVSNFWTQRMHEVQTDLTLTRHGFIGYAVVINAHFWQHLSGAQRQQIQQALDDAIAWGNSTAAGQNEKALGALRAVGSTRIHQPSPAQRAALRAAVQPVYDDLERRIGRSWLAAVRDALPGQ
ncbi:MAG: DctP family TRAP transporter solute-binding subunit [Pseudomonadota bacterium]|jgi:C4-dicarboxylate-binding protein DctP